VTLVIASAHGVVNSVMDTLQTVFASTLVITYGAEKIPILYPKSSCVRDLSEFSPDLNVSS
jgi:hypothetical protein